LYGLHDPGGEQVMLQGNVPGWVLVTVAIGSNADDTSPGDDTRFFGDYRPLSDRGLGVIVRLNNGYNPVGTLPPERDYDAFARRCANFVRISKGCHLWQIGNETNHPIEWPGAQWDWNASPPRPLRPDTTGEKITPQRYAACYRKVRTAIRALPGHELDQVLVAGVAPWNNLTNYPENPNGDWVQYFGDVLKLLGPANCDGVTIHAYTHGTDPAFVVSSAKVGDGRFSTYHWHFRTYQDFMRVIPQDMRGLPVYLTESNQGDVPWNNANTGWVREAYKEIDRWNREGGQQIRSLILYRWPRVGDDRWWIDGKQGVIDDFREAFGPRYQWKEIVGPDLAALEQQVSALERQFQALRPALDQIAGLAPRAAQLSQTIAGLTQQGQQATATQQQVAALDADIARLETEVNALAAGAVPQPDMQDLRTSLPAAPNRQYPRRNLDTVRRVVVHHTATKPDVTPQRVAQFQVGQGLPGIKYHFYITGDGQISWTQPVEALTAQTSVDAVNADGVAVCLAGDFNKVVPGDAQLESAAQTIAWLLSTFRLPADAVIGRSEVDPSDPSGSPGMQWLAGAKYKEPLVTRVQAIVDAAQPQDPVIQELRQRIIELEQRIATLEQQAGQVPALQQEVQTLRSQVSQLQTQVSQLTAQNTQLRTENARLLAQLQNSTGGSGVNKPAITDIVESLPKHPTLPPYEKRTAPIRRIVVHHTDTPPTMTVRQIADYHVNGERRDANGNLVKAQWPGIGYHFVLGPDGTIYQTNRTETRSYHAGPANNDSVGVSLIGRFMKRNWDGTAIPPERQLPTSAQMDSLARLIAWLMKENGIASVDKIVGHKEVMDTTCPGDQWMGGANWKLLLQQRVEAIRQAPPRPVELMLMFWQHGSLWAEADWRSAQAYIAQFRPATTFTSGDGFTARHVVIVGGEAGVSGTDEARLRTAGVEVYRLAGKNEAETKAMLDALVAANTPWPGAPPLAPRTPEPTAPGIDRPAAPDEWTVPDDFEPNEAAIAQAQMDAPKRRVFVESFGPTRPITLPRERVDASQQTSEVSEDLGGREQVAQTSEVAEGQA
jgi:N-acetyl-anhydromuramyl-L-alanine amidase AmpD